MNIPNIKGFDEAAFQKYFKNTSWLMFGKIFSLAVNLLIIRYLGPVNFGDLSFAEALTAIIAAVGTLGLDSFIIREIIKEPGRKNEILGTALGMRLLVNVLLIPLCIGVYLSFHHFSAKPGTPLTLIVTLLSLASFFKSFNVIDSYFQSQVQSKYVVQVQNACLVVSTIVKVMFVWLQMPLVWFAAALSFDALILALGLVWMYHKRGFNMRLWTFNLNRAKSLLKLSFPLIFSALMVSIYMKIDQVMLKSVGSEEVGIYSAAVKISEAWYFIPLAIVTSVFPALVNARLNDPSRYKKRLSNLYDLLVYISLPVALFFSFFSTDLIHLVYGNRYEGAGPMFSIHIWSGVFVFLGTASSQYLLAEGYTMLSLQRTAAGAVINILLNFWLIPLYGGMGASVATLIACIVSTFYILFIPRTREQGIVMLKSLFLISAFQKIKSH
ncbi:O-antigen/teichoic acid export membrane protein [Pedobacter sp. CAN_A7]|uniref:flippase n=1 Tax=Pedobacter sp. CAN_A7 TaxID=2787722 RepID=UPI0018C8E5FF